MNEKTLMNQLNQGPVAFDEVMAVIENTYHFQPTAFRNGEQYNEAGQNNGSCKIFAFAQHQGLSQQATLNAFGDFYTRDVLENPEGTDHANIRQFMKHGWDGIAFEGSALMPKS